MFELHKKRRLEILESNDIYMDTKYDAMADFYYNRHGDFFITIQKKKKR